MSMLLWQTSTCVYEYILKQENPPMTARHRSQISSFLLWKCFSFFLDNRIGILVRKEDAADNVFCDVDKRSLYIKEKMIKNYFFLVLCT